MPPSDVCQKLSLSPLYFNKTLLQINLNLRTHHKLLPISKQLFWNILEKFHFIILVSCGISSKTLNLLFLTLSTHSLYHKLRFFFIQMGLKMPKLHSGLLRNIKSFILNFFLLNKMNYMFLFKLFAYILTPLIVSDSIYSVFVLKNIETSTINSQFY